MVFHLVTKVFKWSSLWSLRLLRSSFKKCDGTLTDIGGYFIRLLEQPLQTGTSYMTMQLPAQKILCGHAADLIKEWKMEIIQSILSNNKWNDRRCSSRQTGRGIPKQRSKGGPWSGRSELGVESGEGDLLDTRNFKIRVSTPQQTAGTIHLCQVTAECQRAGREIGD